MKDQNIREMFELLVNEPEVDWGKMAKEYSLVEDNVDNPVVTLSLRCRGGIWLRVKTWVLNKILSPYMKLEYEGEK